MRSAALGSMLASPVAEAQSARPPDPLAHSGLPEALALALAVLGAHAHGLASALADPGEELGSIDLPETGPATLDPSLLAPLGPLYLAFELEQAGLLRTAELIAGLFASGAIQQPLGAAEPLIAAFWQARHDRLDAAERRHLLEQTFEAAYFYPRMQALCSALVAMADNVGPRGRPVSDLREEVGLQESAYALLELLSARAGGMAAYAARGIVDALNQATHFMRERALQAAFGAHDLWGLVGTAGAADGVGANELRQHVELGRAGVVVLGWLGNAGAPVRLDVRSEQAQTVMGAAQRWLLAWEALRGEGGAV